MTNALKTSAANTWPGRCRLDPTPGTDEVLIRGKTRLAAIIEDGQINEVDPATGRVSRSYPVPGNDQ